MNEFLKVAKYNNPMYNYTKLAEELAELSEVILKCVNKKDEFKPPIGKLIEEAGDVILRLEILIADKNIESDVAIRVGTKLNKLLQHIENGNYKGGV